MICQTRNLPPHATDNELFATWREKDDLAARDMLLARYTPLARKLALRYSRSSEPLDDLVQVAMLGLTRALARFDPDRGRRFSAFAVPTILGELRRYFRDSGWSVHVPRSSQERAMAVEAGVRELTSQLGRSPRVDELSAHTGLDNEIVLDGLQVSAAYSTLSLDAPNQGADGEIEPLLNGLGECDEGFDLVEASATIRAGLPLLSQRDRHILHLRFAHDLTQSQIAEHIGVSQMQVSRVLARSLSTLRDFAEAPATAA